MREKLIKVLPIVTILFFLTSFACKSLQSLDEVWVFNYGLNIAKGGIPYRDVGFLVTPVSYCLLGGILKLFGEEFIVYRCLSFVVLSVVYLLSLHILRKRLKGSVSSQICLSLFFVYFLYTWYYEYNILNILWLLILILCETGEKKNKWIDFFSGSIIALILLTKQTTGLIVVMAAIVLSILNKEKKVCRINKLIGFFIPITGVFCYLTIANLWKEFIEYTIIGVSRFSSVFTKELIYLMLIQHGILFVPLLIYYATNCIQMLISLIKKSELTKENKMKRTVFLYTTASMSIIYPLFDSYHFSLGMLPIIGYALHDLFTWAHKRKTNLVWQGLLCFSIAFAIISYQPNYYKHEKISDINHFRNVFISEESYDMYYAVTESMQKYYNLGYDVYMLDPMAGFFFIPKDEWHNNYDLMACGNVGAYTVEELVSDLLTKNCVVYIRANEEELNYQFPLGLNELIKEKGMTKIDSFGKYNIYKFVIPEFLKC